MGQQSGLFESSLRMVAAAAQDVGGAITGADRGDPFERRDPRYVERTLPALRLASNLYYRADVRIGYKLNRARLTHEIALDVQNVTNRQNVFAERYNVYTGRCATEYQLGLFPIPLYRLTF